MSISRPLVKCTGRRMAVQLARVMPNWKTISCRKAVTTWPKPSSTADTLSSSLDVEKLITSEMRKGSGGKGDFVYDSEQFEIYICLQISARHLQMLPNVYHWSLRLYRLEPKRGVIREKHIQGKASSEKRNGISAFFSA